MLHSLSFRVACMHTQKAAGQSLTALALTLTLLAAHRHAMACRKSALPEEAPISLPEQTAAHIPPAQRQAAFSLLRQRFFAADCSAHCGSLGRSFGRSFVQRFGSLTAAEQRRTARRQTWRTRRRFARHCRSRRLRRTLRQALSRRRKLPCSRKTLPCFRQSLLPLRWRQALSSRSVWQKWLLPLRFLLFSLRRRRKGGMHRQAMRRL